MSDGALDFDVAERRDRQNPARQVQNVRECLFVAEFVHGGTPHHSLDDHLRPDRRHQNGIAVFQSLNVALHSVEQEVIDIDRLHQPVTAVMFQNTHRPAGRRTTGGKQSAERRGERANVVGSRSGDVADFIDSNAPQARKRNIRGNAAKLRFQLELQVLLEVGKTPAADQNGPDFRKTDSALAIHRAGEALRNTAPKIDGETVSRAHDVIRPGGKIHGHDLRVARSVFENFSAESRGIRRAWRGLHVHVVKRGDIVVWAYFSD